MSLSILPRRGTGIAPYFASGPLGSFREEMEDLFSRFMPETAANAGFLSATWPSLDISETDSEIQIKLDTPGLKAEEIDIEIAGDLIRIRGEHEETQEESGRKYHRIERRTGSFDRAVRLPCTVDEKNVDAECRDGVLTVTLAKTEEAKTHKIPVKG